MSPLRAVLAIVLGLGCSALHLSAQEPESTADATALPESPVREGTLPNGLHYAVLPHRAAKGDIGLRLVVHAGSLDEHDDERGFAHFVEHMAFDGTQHFPAGAIRNFFETLGLTFGADLNASTTFTHTTYQIDLPDGRGERLDEALGVMRDYADGVLFLPEQVARESGVVISELDSRDSAAQRTGRQLRDLIYAGTRLPEREPTGVAALLAHATPEQLRAFYRRNYSPERMTLVLVGPIKPAEAIAKITAAFASMVKPPEAVAPALAALPPPFAGVKAEVVVIPTAKGAGVQLVALTARPPDTLAGHRQELVQRIANAALLTRLRARREHEDTTQFGPVRVGYNPASILTSILHTIELPATTSAWDDAVAIIETELRRARTTGFTQAEVDEAVAGQLKAARNRPAEHASSPAGRLAADVARFVASERRWQPPKTDLAEVTQALQGLTATEVTAALTEIFPADNLHLILTVGPDNSLRPEKLLAVFNKSASRTLKTVTTPAAKLRFNYENLGAPGAIAKRERVDDLDLTLVTFANGARLNVRPAIRERGRFRLRVVFPLNYSNLGSDEGGLADLAGQLLLVCDLHKQKQTELARLIKLHGIAPQFSVTNGTPILTMSGAAAELPFALHFLTALLSDLTVDIDHLSNALSNYGSAQHAMTLNPGPLAFRAALRIYAGNDTRVTLNPVQYFARFKVDAIEDWLRSNVINGPLEVGLVGDFTADEAIAAGAASLGTLRNRHAVPRPGAPLTMPKKATRGAADIELPASVAVSCVLWPVTTPDDPPHNAALSLATDVLRDRLLVVLREALGLTYSPDAGVHRDAVQRDFTFAAMVNTFTPANAERLTMGSVKLAALLAEKGVTPEEFARLREPARTRCAEDLRSDAWWLTAIVSTAQTHPEVLENARQHANLYDRVTIEEVNAAAKTFSPDRVTMVVLRPLAAKK